MQVYQLIAGCQTGFKSKAIQIRAWFIFDKLRFTIARSEHPQMRVREGRPHLRMLTPRRNFLQSKCKGDAADFEL